MRKRRFPLSRFACKPLPGNGRQYRTAQTCAGRWNLAMVTRTSGVLMASISDTFGASRKVRILAVIDDCTRENLALIADTRLSGARVARELTAMIRIYCKPV